MSENRFMRNSSALPTAEERRQRIADIRRRKGFLLGRCVVAEGSEPGFVPAIPGPDPLKNSITLEVKNLRYPLCSDYDDPIIYKIVHKGIPPTEVRAISLDLSEYAQGIRRNLPE